MLTVNPAMPQSSNGLPYGGAALTPGSIPVGPALPGPLPPSGNSVCSTGGSTDPCVVTGQNDRYRTSSNVNASKLAGFSDASNFGIANFFKLNSTPHSPFLYEPVLAQPLYVTNVPQPPSGTTTKNILVVASLNDYVYAFDTSQGTGASPLWSQDLATSDCGSTGVPFFNDHSGQPGGVTQLPYYGIVATPVVDITTTPPIGYVVEACTGSWNSTTISWYINAINIDTGAILNSSTPIMDSNFFPSNELSRASLLLTHPSGGGTFVYISFGTGVAEIAAAINSSFAYSGVLAGYQVKFPSSPPYVTFTKLSQSSSVSGFFYTHNSTSSAFPGVYTGFSSGWSGGVYPLDPQGPACDTVGTGCSPGSNWAVNGGGIWMSSKGPSSDASADVYLASGNGAFGCSGSTATDCDGSSSCTSLSGVIYWGESAIEFPTATNGSTPYMGTPADFFAPYVQRYAGTGTHMPNGDLTSGGPAGCQTEELSRLDLDFGVGGVVLIPHSNVFAMTSDKSGYIYVMPAQGSLGLFQPSDSGLTSGTYKTQPPFQLSRLPTSTDQTCEIIDSSGNITQNCDEVHELAFNQDTLFVWPVGEQVESFAGGLSNSNKTYSFNTTGIDPCSQTPNPCTCSGTNCTPKAPKSTAGSSGGGFAIAADNSISQATLWGAVPQSNFSTSNLSFNWGQLFAYTVNSDASLTWIWDSVNGHNCSIPAATGWFVPSFTEPTLADNQHPSTPAGAVYVPTSCVTTNTDGTKYKACGDVPTGSVASGVLVFTSCS